MSKSFAESTGTNSRGRGDPVSAEYRRLAAAYDKRWSRYVRETTRPTLARLAMPASGALLDVGCGTGALLEQAARACPDARLAGVDPVRSMLGEARAKLGGQALLCQARGEALPLADGCFDTVVSSSVLHYVGDPAAALAEMHRVLRPGGQLVLTDWCADHFPTRVVGWYLHALRRPLHRIYRRGELTHLLGDAGFHRVHVERFRIDWLWGLMTATARKHGELRPLSWTRQRSKRRWRDRHGRGECGAHRLGAR